MVAVMEETNKMIEVEVEQVDRIQNDWNSEVLKTQLLELIEDYHWKFDSVKELEKRVFGFSLRVSYGVAEYGIDMVMPKGCSGKSAAELDAMELKEKRAYERLLQYKAEIDLIDYIPAVIQFESAKMHEMYEDMLVGKKLAEIANKLGQDRKTARSMRNRMLKTAIENDYVLKFLQEGFNKRVKSGK